MARKRGTISGEVNVQCPECATVLAIDVDGEWKDGDVDGRTVYSHPFICTGCSLLWSIQLKVKGLGPIQTARPVVPPFAGAQ